MIHFWKSLPIPHLDYCCRLWSPKRKGEINKLEILQKYFNRRIDGLNELDHWERLQNLFQLSSVERRRETYIIVCVLENMEPNITTECIRGTLNPELVGYISFVQSIRMREPESKPSNHPIASWIVRKCSIAYHRI